VAKASRRKSVSYREKSRELQKEIDGCTTQRREKEEEEESMSSHCRVTPERQRCRLKACRRQGCEDSTKTHPTTTEGCLAEEYGGDVHHSQESFKWY